MPSDKKQIKVYLTDAQVTALNLATTKSGLSASDARREALRLFCKSYGVVFPDDMPQHGGTRARDFDPELWGISDQEIFEHYQSPDILYRAANEVYATTLESVQKWWDNNLPY